MRLRFDRARNALFQPGVLTTKDLLRDAVNGRVVLTEEAVEERVHTHPRLATEQIRQSDSLSVPLLGEHLRANAGRGNRKQLRADVDGPEEHHLLSLEPRPEPHHRME